MKTDNLNNDNTSKEEKLLIARAKDAYKRAEDCYMVTSVGFLNPRERTLLKRQIMPTADMKTEYNGGFEHAERTMLIIRPEYAELSIDDIISVVKISGRELSKLSHRDYLGSLMGLGITRENIGDILVYDDGAYVFAKKHIAEYVLQNLTKIGNKGIKCTVCSCSEVMLPAPKIKEKGGTVASLRLDGVLAFAAGLSRGHVVEMINKGMVCVNYEVASSTSLKMSEGDLISVRGIGRMQIANIGNVTRKGRIGITINKYE